MLSQFNSSTVPSETNIKDVIISVAHYTLLSQPYYALHEIRRGMIYSHPQLWETSNPTVAVNLYNALSPSTERVWSMVIEPTFKNATEARVFDRVFDYFRRFILSLGTE